MEQEHGSLKTVNQWLQLAMPLARWQRLGLGSGGSSPKKSLTAPIGVINAPRFQSSTLIFLWISHSGAKLSDAGLRNGHIPPYVRNRQHTGLAADPSPLAVGPPHPAEPKAALDSGSFVAQNLTPRISNGNRSYV